MNGVIHIAVFQDARVSFIEMLSFLLQNRAIKSELRGFHDDRAKYDGGAQDEPPERKSTKTWQEAAWKQRLISVHDFCRTPEAQPFNPVPCRVHPHQADTHSGMKRRAEESDYYKSREHQTEHVRSVAAFPTAE
jgi:hypothetical protein